MLNYPLMSILKPDSIINHFEKDLDERVNNKNVSFH